jgi:Na+(H+)/acetate symporter ActP
VLPATALVVGGFGLVSAALGVLKEGFILDVLVGSGFSLAFSGLKNSD